MVDAVCKNCCFAHYDFDGFTQLSCDIGILDKFSENDSEVLECYDEDKAFYVIKNRVCPYTRRQEWLDNQSDDENLINKIKNETKYGFGATIFLYDDDETKLERTLSSLRNMDRKFTTLHIFRKTNNKIHPDRIRELLKDCAESWKIHNVISTVNEDKFIMNVIKVTKDSFMTLIKCGNLVDPLLITKTRDFILDDLMQFAMIVDGDNYLIPSTVFSHWYHQGDSKKRVHEEIGELCQKKQTVFKIKNGQIY